MLKNPSATIAFINFRLSPIKEHGSSEAHKTGVDEAEREKAIAVGEPLAPKHVVHEIPENSAIASGLFRRWESKDVPD